MPPTIRNRQHAFSAATQALQHCFLAHLCGTENVSTDEASGCALFCPDGTGRTIRLYGTRVHDKVHSHRHRCSGAEEVCLKDSEVPYPRKRMVIADEHAPPSTGTEHSSIARTRNWRAATINWLWPAHTNNSLSTRFLIQRSSVPFPRRQHSKKPQEGYFVCCHGLRLRFEIAFSGRLHHGLHLSRIQRYESKSLIDDGTGDNWVTRCSDWVMVCKFVSPKLKFIMKVISITITWRHRITAETEETQYYHVSASFWKPKQRGSSMLIKHLTHIE